MTQSFTAHHIPLLRDYVQESVAETCEVDPYYAGAEVTVTDPLAGSVLLLLNGSGTITTDSSSYARTITTAGSPTLDATNPHFGLNTYVVPAGSSVKCVADRFLSEGNYAGEWCIEMWIKFTSTGNGASHLSFGGGSVFSMTRNASNQLGGNCSSVSFSSLSFGSHAGCEIPNDTWAHVAWVRDNTTDPTWGYMNLYINGVKVSNSSSFVKNATLWDNAAGFGQLLGYQYGTPNGLVASEYRITRGSARYYANFTPATTPQNKAQANTVLGLHFDGVDGGINAIDSSAYARTLTKVGGAVISNAAAKYGATSGKPNGGYWSVPDAADLRVNSGDFTAEAWVNAERPVGAPYAGLLSLLFHADGANGSTSFPAVVPGLSGVRLGSAQIVTDAAAFGGSQLSYAKDTTDQCVRFDKTGGFITQPDWTVDFFFTLTDAPSGAEGLNYNSVWTLGQDSTTERLLTISGPTQGLIWAGNQIGGTATIAGLGSSRHHIRVCRRYVTGSYKVGVWVDGVLQNNITSGANPAAHNQLWVGCRNNPGGGSTCHGAKIDEFTIYDGVALSPSLSDSFTVPTTPVQDQPDTALIVGQTDGIMGAGEWALILSAAGNLQLNYDAASTLAATTPWPPAEWVHVAVARSGATTRLFQNGVMVASASVLSPLSATSGVCVGGSSGILGSLNGYLDDARITRGVARYTADFTPPSRTFCDAAGACEVDDYSAGVNTYGSTFMLLHFEGTHGATIVKDTLLDSSQYGRGGYNITGAGLIFSNAQVKFGNTSMYSPGGGLGGVDYVGLEWQTFGSDSFTIDFWYRPSSKTGLFNVISNYYDGGTNATWSINNNTSSIDLMMCVGGVRYTASSASNLFVVNQWHHVAMVRDGTVARLYLDGVQICSVTVGSGELKKNTGFESSWRVYLVYGNNANYMDEFRVLRGVCAFPGGTTFTPPTAPYVETALVPETVALLHFDGSNGATSFTDSSFTPLSWTAAGTAAISTSRSKFNASSLAPGNGYVYATDPSVTMGSKDFTVEGWVYVTAHLADPQAQFFFGQHSGSASSYNDIVGSWSLCLCRVVVASPPRLQLSFEGSQVLLSGLAWPLGEWVHVAITRSGATTKVWQNGALAGTVNSAGPVSFHNAQFFRIGGSTGTVNGGSNAASVNGNIDEVRITKGAVRYTAPFTPPSFASCGAGEEEQVIPEDGDTPSGLRFDVVETPCLDATEGAALGATTIATVDSASNGPTAVYSNVPPGLTPVFNWVGPTAGSLSISGTPIVPGVYRMRTKFYENNSKKVLGDSEIDITVWPAAGTFSPGALASPSGRVGVPATLQLTAPSANYNVDISVVANLPVPGMSLVTAWTPGVTSSGTVSLVGTPTAAGTYALTLTYRRKSTCEIRDLATSVHTVTIGALAAPPAPAPAPAPAPTPAPSPAPTPPGISQGPVPDNLWSSVAILQQWNNSRTVMYELGDSRVDFATLYMDARGRHEMDQPVPFSATEGAGDAGAAGGSSLCYVGDSLWQTDGNLTAECFYRMSAADIAYLFSASTETRLLVMMSLNSNSGTGNFMWKLGYSSSIEGGRRVVRPTFIQGRTGGPVGNSPIQCFGPEIASPPYAFFHLAGQVVLSGGTTELAAWHNGVGGGATKIATSGQSYRLVSGNNFRTHTGDRPNCAPTGGLTYSGTRSASGYIDQIRVTKAQRYTATAGVTDAIDRAKITPPFLAS